MNREGEIWSVPGWTDGGERWSERDRKGERETHMPYVDCADTGSIVDVLVNCW